MQPCHLLILVQWLILGFRASELKDHISGLFEVMESIVIYYSSYRKFIHYLKKKTEFIERAFSSLQLQLPCAVLSCVWLFGTLPTRLFCPWDVPGKNTGAGYHFFFQGIFLSQGSNSSLLHWQVDSLPLSHVGSPGRTDAEAESPILWPPDMKSQLTGKDAAAGKDWGQE